MGVATRRVRLLGWFEVEGLENSAFGSRKGRTLLKRLAVEAGGPVSVDTLTSVLWADDETPARPSEQISVLVSRLRRVLGQDAIAFADGSYRLVVDWIDVNELRARVDEAARRLEDGSPAQSRAAAAAALALVCGPLLSEDLDQAWTQAARVEADRLVRRAQQVAAEGALASGLAIEAAEHAAAALASDPYDEVALRLLMRAHVAAGRPALALSAYAATAKLVSEELGVDLDPQTQALHLSVLQGDGSLTLELPFQGQSVALAGRESELAALTGAFERAAAGDAVVVVVEGEAGIGKTRLLAAFADRVGESAQVLRANADSAGVLPMQPILEVLARRFNTVPEAERAALLGPEADLLGPLLRPGTKGDVTAYRDLLVAYEPGEQSAPAVLHLAVLSVVARLCEQRPVVLLIEDAHLADAATLSWLGLAARHGAGMRLLAVLSRRPGAADISGSETVVLARLDAAAAAEIAARYVAPARVAEVVERSAGLPLFLVELAQAKTDALPDSIREAVAARVTEIGPAATTLHAAAVLGGEVDVDLLSTVLDRPTPELLDDLEIGARHRILDDASTGYVFHHELIRESLEADTPAARRAWLHREAAAALARRTPGEHLSVAHHARLGGNAGLAAQALCAAAEQAGARFDHDAALALAADSLSLAETAEAHLVRARSFVLLRQCAEALEEAEKARVLGAGGSALEVAAFAAYYARDLDSVLRFADEAATTSDDPELLDACQYLAAKVLHTRGQISAAGRRLEEMALAPDRSRTAAFARTWQTLVDLHRGDVEAATRDLAGSQTARLAPIPHAPLYVDQFATHLASLAGRPLEALAIAERLIHAAREQSAVRFFGRGEVYRGWALSLLCAPSALEVLQEARVVARAAGNPEPLGQGGLDLAALHLDAGRTEAAATALDQVDEVLAAGAQVSNGWRIRLRADYLRGRAAFAGGDFDAAQEAADRVVARAREDAIARYDVLGRTLGFEARAAAGERVAVEDVLALLPALRASARPEAWRVAARLGHALRSDALLAWSATQVGELAEASGEYADRIRADAAALLNADR